ncbi:hypothetical protein NP511_17995 [Natrinema thermotolerans]|uniref:Uncharacterized protein n=1 Tax=Natrinema thermotolerans TaxID=121872 RepID=A0AAF0P8C0_9EURY|nr:hypothetical protein [Natrinema thermotolerans]QCC60249.1 hypothetical protein DVR14_17065 [Natrinema thermotolerans]QCC61161.1 hypothetical protein DVR14_21195 [Natrinema thermotolerans]WMT07268.1 hypothetical protein NP511_17995 [Natrinema thermotolerans]
MILKYLYAEDCPVCNGLKNEGIVFDIQRLLEPLPDVHWVSGPVGQFHSRFTLTDDGDLGDTSITEGQMMHDVARDSPDDYQNLATPMLQVTTARSPEAREEFFLSSVLGDNSHEIGQKLEQKQWLCKRLIARKILQCYLQYELSLDPIPAEQIREVGTREEPPLEPELNHGIFQINEWTHAFIRADQLRY